MKSPATPCSDGTQDIGLDAPGRAQQMLYSPEREFVPQNNVGQTTMPPLPQFYTGADAYPLLQPTGAPGTTSGTAQAAEYRDTDMDSDTISIPRSQSSMQSGLSKFLQKSSNVARRAKSPIGRKGSERDRSTSLTKLKREKEKMIADLRK